MHILMPGVTNCRGALTPYNAPCPAPHVNADGDRPLMMPIPMPPWVSPVGSNQDDGGARVRIVQQPRSVAESAGVMPQQDAALLNAEPVPHGDRLGNPRFDPQPLGPKLGAEQGASDEDFGPEPTARAPDG